MLILGAGRYLGPLPISELLEVPTKKQNFIVEVGRAVDAECAWIAPETSLE